MKKYKDYFILTGLILLIVLVTTGPHNLFGSNTDWLNQHTIFPDYFRQMFYHTKKLLPNFAINYGAGQNIFNISYYGLLNPIVLLSYLFPFLEMKTYMIIINIISIISSSILFYKFIKLNNFNNKICLLTSILFTISMPLIFHMQRHIMFVNYMPFLLMSLIGVIKYLEKEKTSLLIISIFLMIMTSYYYSVSSLLVIFLYYLYKYLSNNKFNLKKILKFIIILIIPVLMSMILLLPTLYTLLEGREKSVSGFNYKLFIPNFNMHKLFCDYGSLGLGFISFISLIYLLYTKKKENTILGIVLSLILFIPLSAYILNGTLYTQEKCFIPFIPLFSYLIAIFLNDLFKNKIEIKKFTILILTISIILFIIKPKLCYISLPFILLSFITYDKYHKSKIVSITLILIGLTFLFISFYKEEKVSINMYNEIFDKEIDNKINEVINGDTNYYRFINLHYNLKTINKIYNNKYYTTSLYSSNYNKDYLKFNREIFKTNRTDYNYFLISSNSDILYNTFMGVKYIYSKENLPYPYEKISDNIYINKYTYPLIYTNDKTISNKEFDNYSYPYKNYLLLKNVVINNNSNNSNKINIHKINPKYKIISNYGVDIKQNILEVKDQGKLTVELDTPLINKILFIKLTGLKENKCKPNNINLTINGVTNSLTCTRWFYPNKNNTFHYTISEKNIKYLTIELTKGTYNIDDVEAYTMDNEELTNNDITPLNIKSITVDNIKGNITVPKDGYLVTSIPYDEGFTIKIDDKVTPKEKVNTAFLGTPIKEGTHKVEITYSSPYLKEGKILSLIGFGLFLITIYIEKRKSLLYNTK